jgi:hypothetical protein
MTRYALGRNVRHDPRSLAYKVIPAGTIRSVEWKRHIPILDQGDLGSCTGNAGTGVLGSDGLWQTLTSAAQAQLNEKYAVQLYSDATKLDDDPQNYPPTDTGSDGLSIAQVLKARKLVAGYQHITSLAAAHTAIQTGPFITGTNWYDGMFDPDSSNIVSISGTIAGGHEYEVVGYDATKALWKCANSWGTSWGDAGYFYMSDATYARLLAEQGDATTFVPIGLPAPTPQPTPVSALAAAEAILDPWAAARHTGSNAKAAAAWKAYRATV